MHWVHAHVGIRRSSPLGVAIEFTEPTLLEERDAQFRATGQELATNDRSVVMNSNAGVMIKPIGVAIASLCGGFDLAELAVGSQHLSDMRRVILSHPAQLGRYRVDRAPANCPQGFLN